MREGADDERRDDRRHADGEEERDDRDETADGGRDRRRERRPPRIGKILLRESELLVYERPEKLLRFLVDAFGHGARLVGREPLELVEQLQLEQLLVRVFFDLGALTRHFGLVHLALRL